MIFWEGGYYHRGNYDAVNLLTKGIQSSNATLGPPALLCPSAAEEPVFRQDLRATTTTLSTARLASSFGSWSRGGIEAQIFLRLSTHVDSGCETLSVVQT